jgi:acyl-CoA thioesterase-1
MGTRLIRVTAALLAVFALGCGGNDRPSPTGPGSTPPPVVVALGDSLTAGFGVRTTEAYPALLHERARAGGFPHLVVNAGRTGDTTSDGLSRLDAALHPDTKVLILALGANDGIIGVPVSTVRQNLRQIIQRVRARNIRVLLTGMIAPPTRGLDYAVQFGNIFPELAAEFELPLMPFLLNNVLGRPELNLADGIHPNAAGQRVIANEMWPYLEPLLRATTP